MKKKILFTCAICILLVFAFAACNNDAGNDEANAPKITPDEAIQGYWYTEVNGIVISYKFENGVYYGSLAAKVNGEIVDTDYSRWGTYKVNEKDNQIALTLDENGETSKMRYEFSDEKITYLAIVSKNGSDGSVLKRMGELK